MGVPHLFPKIALYKEDTLASVEARLAKAIFNNAKEPGIKPIYTVNTLKEEAARLYQNVPYQSLQQN
jgi:hypothetical protein